MTSRCAARSPHARICAAILVAAVAALCRPVAAPAAGAAAPSLEFGAPVSLTSGADNAEGPRVAVDRRGAATAVWYDHEADRSLVRSSWRPAGGSWSAPVEISDPHRVRFVSEVDVAMTAGGEAIAVWTGATGPNVDIGVVQTATRSAAGEWSAPRDISRSAGRVGSIRLEADPRGDAVVVWAHGAFGANVVQAATRADGGAWSAPADLSAAGRSAWLPDVGIDDAGEATAVWTISTSDARGVQTSSRPAGGAWTAPEDLTGPGGALIRAQVAVGGRGHAIAVWSRGVRDGGVVAAAVRSASGAWSAAADLAGDGAFTPRAAIGDRGQAIVVWRQYRPDGTAADVNAVARTAAGTWRAPVELGGFASEIDVAMTPKGEAVAVWSAWNAVRASTTRSGRTWSSARTLASAPADVALDYVDAAIGDRGHAVAVWRRWTPFTTGVVEAVSGD